MEDKIKKLVSDLEDLQHANAMEAAFITGELPFQQLAKERYTAKASAYRFVIRKIKRNFPELFQKQLNNGA